MLKRTLALGISFQLSLYAVVSWNPVKAARYLDQRQHWWETWAPAQRDHSTVCISCHTSLPYMLARPALHSITGESRQSDLERRVIESVTMRVDHWHNIDPYYADSAGTKKRLQSLGTESVLNALILMEGEKGSGAMSPVTRTAFAYMWDLQQKKAGIEKGSWPWLDFSNEPFEARDSAYFGAALAAVAVELAPPAYRAEVEVQKQVALLDDYLRRGIGTQSILNQLAALWASGKSPTLLSSPQRISIINAVLDKQRRDGGWSTASLCCNWQSAGLESVLRLWIRSDATPMSGKSDGFAAGFALFVLRQVGVPSDDLRIRRARSWLIANQDRTTGSWPGYSLNRHVDSSSQDGLFMTDAATAWAVLALTTPDALEPEK